MIKAELEKNNLMQEASHVHAAGLGKCSTPKGCNVGSLPQHKY